MQKELKNIINHFNEEETLLNKIIVSSFVKINSIKVMKNTLIKSLLIEESSEIYSHISKLKAPFTFDDVIEAFELAIPTKEKVINGAVYTPRYIKKFIIDNSLTRVAKPIESILAADISCGCGAFLFTLSGIIKSETSKSFFEIFDENIYGLDISESSIQRTKILLSLFAIAKGEDIENFSFNLFVANSLSFNWSNSVKKVKKNNGFDLIVGNPPYVRAKNIDDASKSLLSEWSVTKSGNSDLYIPFFEIGLRNLNQNGVLGYITVNSFYKSVNARELRKYLQKCSYDMSIIDFGHEKIFSGKSAYTCICIIVKTPSARISFRKSTGQSLFENSAELYNQIQYIDLDHQKGWLLNDNVIVQNIKRIETSGTSLGAKYKIRNGIATLSNDIYIFKPINEVDEYYILRRNNIDYKIEKTICRDIIKPNVLKIESEINDIKEKLIYPYTNGISPLTLMNEDQLKTKFPCAYIYLSDYKNELSKRDKGNSEYGAWYAFGRTQALSDKGYKLLFPYIAKEPRFIFTDDKDMLIYCGYAIFHESVEELKILKKVLESKVFEYYIANTSKPYSGGYFSYAKNYVKNFSICNFSEDEKCYILGNASQSDFDKFLISKYKITI